MPLTRGSLTSPLTPSDLMILILEARPSRLLNTSYRESYRDGVAFGFAVIDRRYGCATVTSVLTELAMKHRSPSDLPAATRQCLPQNGWFRLWGVIRTARQSHGEHRALARLARHGHIARRRSDTSALKHRGRPGHESSKFFMQRTATPLTCSPSIYLPHSS
jgi:hypothetical protein